MGAKHSHVVAPIRFIWSRKKQPVASITIKNSKLFRVLQFRQVIANTARDSEGSLESNCTVCAFA